MGKPATTYWCGNGHLLEDNSDHTMGTYDSHYDGKCPYCGSAVILMTVDWHGYDCDDTYNPEVPYKPVGHFDVQQRDHYDNLYYIEVPVYNVSKLLARREENAADNKD